MATYDNLDTHWQNHEAHLIKCWAAYLSSFCHQFWRWGKKNSEWGCQMCILRNHSNNLRRKIEWETVIRIFTKKQSQESSLIKSSEVPRRIKIRSPKLRFQAAETNQDTNQFGDLGTTASSALVQPTFQCLIYVWHLSRGWHKRQDKQHWNVKTRSQLIIHFALMTKTYSTTSKTLSSMSLQFFFHWYWTLSEKLQVGVVKPAFYMSRGTFCGIKVAKTIVLEDFQQKNNRT